MVRKLMNVLIAYATTSGNTQEVAEMVSEVLTARGYAVTLYRVGGNTPFPAVKDFDMYMLGTYTIGKGRTPGIVKRFVAAVGYKPPVTYIFGTGDTQFGGDELFCHSAVKLAKFYNVEYPVLRIEQRPKGAQEKSVIDWTEGVINYENTKSQSTRASES